MSTEQCWVDLEPSMARVETRRPVKVYSNCLEDFIELRLRTRSLHGIQRAQSSSSVKLT